MAKKVIGQIKLQIPAGKATPAPPVGPALGQHGVNIMGFTKEFNAKTAAELKMPDLNAASVESAMRMIAGTARSMGIVVED